MKKILDNIKYSAARVKAYRLARWDNQQDYEHDGHIFKVNKRQKMLYFLSNTPIFLFVMCNFIFDSIYNPSTAVYLLMAFVTAIIMYIIIVILRMAFLRESNNCQIK